MNINPVAFSIFGLDVMWYGILIALGVLLALFFSNKLAESENLYKGVVSDLGIYAILLGVLGARLYYVAFNLDYYSQHPGEILAIRNGGLAIYGGIITGCIVIFVFSKIKKIKFLKLLDILAPSVALAQGIGRWGNFINQEAYGRETNLPWAIEINGVFVHPTFLYESIIDICIFLFLYFYMYKRKKFDGQISALYMIFYGIGRFFVEGLRTDSLYLGMFRISQLVSIGFIIIGLGIIFTQRNKSK